MKKKDDFQWHEGAEIFFQRIKDFMRSFPILSFPNFYEPFVLECDASGEGIGAVLRQGQHPIAFESRKIQPHENIDSIYDKELLAIMHALIKVNNTWWGTSFWLRLTIIS